MRFLSKRSAISTFDQQTAPVRARNDNESRVLTHGDQISQSLLPSGHIGRESRESSLHKVFMSCELLRGKDNGELPTLFKDNLKDIYEDIIMNNNDDY